jgi:hypothetical protein
MSFDIHAFFRELVTKLRYALQIQGSKGIFAYCGKIFIPNVNYYTAMQEFT